MARTNKAHEEQADVMEWARLAREQRRELWSLFPIFSPRSVQMVLGERQAKLLGTRGVPDLFLAYPFAGYHGLFITFRRWRSPKTDEPAQFSWVRLLSSFNYVCYVCDDATEAVEAIEAYLRHPDMVYALPVPDPTGREE